MSGPEAGGWVPCLTGAEMWEGRLGVRVPSIGPSLPSPLRMALSHVMGAMASV